MSILDKVFSKASASIIGEAGKIVDQVVSSDTEKGDIKNKLTDLVTKTLLEVQSNQSKVILAEAKGNFLQKSWRPIVMLMFAFVVVYGCFVEIPYLSEGHPFWGLLKLGIGGYIGGRSLEKITESVTKNIDLPFLKKKNRENK